MLGTPQLAVFPLLLLLFYLVISSGARAQIQVVYRLTNMTNSLKPDVNAFPVAAWKSAEGELHLSSLRCICC